MYVTPVEPSQPEMGADYITAQCEDPIKISLIDEKVSFLKFWVQNPIQEHVLHLIVLSPQGSSVCNSGSVPPLLSLAVRKRLPAPHAPDDPRPSLLSCSWTQDTYSWQEAPCCVPSEPGSACVCFWRRCRPPPSSQAGVRQTSPPCSHHLLPRKH